jgi:hypothetical protein
MPKQNIFLGSNPNDPAADTLYDGATKINSNFNEIYSTFGNGSTLTTGTQGSQGSSGAQGNQGNQGSQGFQGPAGPFTFRSSFAVVTPTISNGSSSNVPLVGYKSYALLKIQTSAAAWVTIYSDPNSRSNDSARTELIDPLPGSGVIAEVITTGNQTVLMTPAPMGFNNEATPTENIYLKIVNKSGSTQAITVTLTLLKLEA